MARLTPSELAHLKTAIHDIAARQDNTGDNKTSLRQVQALEFDKWRLIHKYIHSAPFNTRDSIDRSQQWRQAVPHVRDLGEVDLLDWVLLQVQVARNLERGIQDMRPRKNGACHGLILEYVANRKRKAHAVLNWATEGEKHGVYHVDSKWHAKTANILERYGLIEKDEDGNRIYSNDPLARS